MSDLCLVEILLVIPIPVP